MACSGTRIVAFDAFKGLLSSVGPHVGLQSSSLLASVFAMRAFVHLAWAGLRMSGIFLRNFMFSTKGKNVVM